MKTIKLKVIVLMFVTLSVIGGNAFSNDQPLDEKVQVLVNQYLNSIDKEDINLYKLLHHPNAEIDLSKVRSRWETGHNKPMIKKLQILYKENNLILTRADIETVYNDGKFGARLRIKMLFVLQKWGNEWKILDVIVLDEQPIG